MRWTRRNDLPITETDLRLFAIDPNGRLYVYGAGEAFTPRSGWRVIVLSEKTDEKKASERETDAA